MVRGLWVIGQYSLLYQKGKRELSKFVLIVRSDRALMEILKIREESDKRLLKCSERWKVSRVWVDGVDNSSVEMGRRKESRYREFVHFGVRK